MRTDEMMIGLDPHKASNTIAVLDRAEAVEFRGRFDHSEEGIGTMLAAVAAWPNRVWAKSPSATTATSTTSASDDPTPEPP